jgi:hypothetical protein
MMIKYMGLEANELWSCLHHLESMSKPTWFTKQWAGHGTVNTGVGVASEVLGNGLSKTLELQPYPEARISCERSLGSGEKKHANPCKPASPEHLRKRKKGSAV